MCQTNRQTHKVKLAVSGPFRSQKSLSISKKALTLIQGFMKRVLLCTMRVRCLLSEHFHEFEWENGCGRLHRYTGALHIMGVVLGYLCSVCTICQAVNFYQGWAKQTQGRRRRSRRIVWSPTERTRDRPKIGQLNKLWYFSLTLSYL